MEGRRDKLNSNFFFLQLLTAVAAKMPAHNDASTSKASSNSARVLALQKANGTRARDLRGSLFLSASKQRLGASHPRLPFDTVAGRERRGANRPSVSAERGGHQRSTTAATTTPVEPRCSGRGRKRRVSGYANRGPGLLSSSVHCEGRLQSARSSLSSAVVPRRQVPPPFREGVGPSPSTLSSSPLS